MHKLKTRNQSLATWLDFLKKEQIKHQLKFHINKPSERQKYQHIYSIHITRIRIEVLIFLHSICIQLDEYTNARFSSKGIIFYLCTITMEKNFEKYCVCTNLSTLYFFNTGLKPREKSNKTATNLCHKQMKTKWRMEKKFDNTSSSKDQHIF